MQKLLILTLILISQVAMANRIDIWPTIPFNRGADLCRYNDAYSSTRTEYMREMVNLSRRLMSYGAYGSEAMDMLVQFNSLYDRNIQIATRAKYLDVTLESTLKSYIDQYYRNLRVRERKISFRHMNHIHDIVRAINNGERIGNINNQALSELDFFAYGSYSYAPDCRGKILVTLTLVGRDGRTKNYLGNGKPSVVMSQIASQMFEDFQRTQFPSTINISGRNRVLLGGLNGDIGEVSSPRYAQDICESMGAKLPNQIEYEIIDSYGSWSGGVSITESRKVWAMANNKVFAPQLRSSPVRNPWEVNEKFFKYICIR